MSSQCVILVGGRGTRLGARTTATPAPLIDVGDAPFLETLFAEARRRGFRDFVLLAGRHSDAVVAFLAERDIEKRFDCRVELSIERAPLGTGGALVSALPRLQDGFLLLNGQSWFDFNWLDLLAKSRRDGALAAMALREIGGPKQIGGPKRCDTIEIEGGRVTAMRARSRALQSGLADGGAYYFTRRALEGFLAPCSLAADILPELARRGALRGYSYSGFFTDVGVPEELASAADLVPLHRRRRAVFFDRDGVLNIDRGYVHVPEQVEWVQGSKEAVKLFNDAGYYVFVVTNQAGVARGFFREEAVGALHRWMADELAAIGGSVDDWRYCPFHPEGSVAAYRAAHDWRKPNPGMILDLIAHWPIEREDSVLIGDKMSDLQAAEAAGVAGHLFRGGDLLEFVRGLGLPLVRSFRGNVKEPVKPGGDA